MSCKNRGAKPKKPLPSYLELPTSRALPRVAVCVPSGDMVHKGFAMSLALLAYECRSHDGLPRVPLEIVGTQSSLIVINRCLAVARAQQLGVDYVLFLDSDMQFPADTLRRLLAHGKDIVGATYVQRVPPHRLLGIYLPETKLTTDRPHEVLALPAGCLLIKLSIFDGMPEPYFHTPVIEHAGDRAFMSEDYYFCNVARERGHQIWCDVALSEQIGHIGSYVNTIANRIGDLAQGKPVRLVEETNA